MPTTLPSSTASHHHGHTDAIHQAPVASDLCLALRPVWDDAGWLNAQQFNDLSAGPSQVVPVPTLRWTAGRVLARHVHLYAPECFLPSTLPVELAKVVYSALTASIPINNGIHPSQPGDYLANWLHFARLYGSELVLNVARPFERHQTLDLPFPQLLTLLPLTHYPTSPLHFLSSPSSTSSTFLTSLSLARTPVVDDQLSSLNRLHCLTSLDLSETAITDTAIRNLASALYVSSSSLPHEHHARRLPPTSHRSLCRLKVWVVQGCRGVTDHSAKSFAKFPKLGLVGVDQTSCTTAFIGILNRASSGRLISQPNVPSWRPAWLKSPKGPRSPLLSSIDKTSDLKTKLDLPPSILSLNIQTQTSHPKTTESALIYIRNLHELQQQQQRKSTQPHAPCSPSHASSSLSSSTDRNHLGSHPPPPSNLNLNQPLAILKRRPNPDRSAPSMFSIPPFDLDIPPLTHSQPSARATLSPLPPLTLPLPQSGSRNPFAVNNISTTKPSSERIAILRPVAEPSPPRSSTPLQSLLPSRHPNARLLEKHPAPRTSSSSSSSTAFNPTCSSTFRPKKRPKTNHHHHHHPTLDTFFPKIVPKPLPSSPAPAARQSSQPLFD